MIIAIVRLSAMGDIIHSAIVLQFIKKAFKDIKLYWIVEKSMAEVLRYNTDIDNIIELELKKFKKTKKLSDLFQQIKMIKSLPKYDYIIDMQGLLKSSIITKLMNGNSYGYDKNSIREGIASYLYNFTTNIPYNENTIDRNVGLIADVLSLKISPKDIHNKLPFLFYKNEDKLIYNYLQKDKKNIIFVIGSTWTSRNYPKEKFVELANKLKENILVVWASAQEKEDGEFIEKNSKYATLVPKIDINTLKALIAQSDLLIGNDTGPTHMAWALNIPSVTIFGPTPINRVYITDINKVIKSSSKVNHYKLDKNDFSIKEIAVDDIVDMTKEIF